MEKFPSTAEEVIVTKLSQEQWDVISGATEDDPELRNMIFAQSGLIDLDIPEGQSIDVSVEVDGDVKKIKVTNIDGTYDFNTRTR
jgi:hypothetical protein